MVVSDSVRFASWFDEHEASLWGLYQRMSCLVKGEDVFMDFATFVAQHSTSYQEDRVRDDLAELPMASSVFRRVSVDEDAWFDFVADIREETKYLDKLSCVQDWSYPGDDYDDQESFYDSGSDEDVYSDRYGQRKIIC